MNPPDLALSSNRKTSSSRYRTVDQLIDDIPVSSFHIRLLFLCGLVFMADAMEIALLSFISSCAGKAWHLSYDQRASIASAVFSGQLIGCLVWGKVADMYGRRITYIGSLIILTVCGVLSAFASSFEWLIVFRTCCGFGIGGSGVAFDLLAEILPTHIRGAYLLYIEFFFTIGAMAINGLAWLFLADYGWRVLTFLASLPFFLILSMAFFYLPESPRWLMIHGRSSDAKNVLDKMAQMAGYDAGSYTLRPVLTANKDASWLELFKISHVSLPLGIIWFCFGLTYYGIILLVSRLYSVSSDDGGDDGNTCQFEYKDIFINSSAEILGLLVVVMIIERYGRVNIQTILYLVGGIMLILMGCNFSPLSVTVLAWFGRFAAMGSSSLTWIVTSEILPTEYRASGHSVFNSLARLGGFASPYLVYSSISNIGVAMGLAAFNIVAAFCSSFLPETKGLSLDCEVIRHSIADTPDEYSVLKFDNETILSPILDGDNDDFNTVGYH